MSPKSSAGRQQCFIALNIHRESTCDFETNNDDDKDSHVISTHTEPIQLKLREREREEDVERR